MLTITIVLVMDVVPVQVSGDEYCIVAAQMQYSMMLKKNKNESMLVIMPRS